jgi:hypothetical protein
MKCKLQEKKELNLKFEASMERLILDYEQLADKYTHVESNLEKKHKEVDDLKYENEVLKKEIQAININATEDEINKLRDYLNVDFLIMYRKRKMRLE